MVWGDNEVAMLAAGKRKGHGERQAAVRTPLVDHLAHGADVDGVALENFDKSLFEHFGSGTIEQLQ